MECVKVYSHLQAPLASLAIKNISFCMCRFTLRHRYRTRYTCHNHNYVFIVSPVVFLIFLVNAFVKWLYVVSLPAHKHGYTGSRGWPSEKSYNIVADASHLIGKRGEPITANRSTPQAAFRFFGILDEFGRVRG